PVDGITVYVPAAGPGREIALFVHEGRTPPPLELADLHAAGELDPLHPPANAPLGERGANTSRSADAWPATLDSDPPIWRGLSGAARGDELPLRLLAAAARQAHTLASLLEDPLTQMPGRLLIQFQLESELARHREGGRALSVMMVNPDDLGGVNAEWGRG